MLDERPESEPENVEDAADVEAHQRIRTDISEEPGRFARGEDDDDDGEVEAHQRIRT